MGWGSRIIAERSGVNRTQVRTLMYGRAPSEQGVRKGQLYARPQHLTKILRTSADKLMAVTFDWESCGPGHTITATGTHRRMQALAAIGYSLAWQAEQLGRIPGNYHQLLGQNTVSIKTWREVKDLYERYEMTTPNAKTRQQRAAVTRSINFARKNGWLVPAMWDNPDFDPQPRIGNERLVDDVIVDELLAGRLAAAEAGIRYGEKELYAEELIRRGMPHKQVQTILKMSGVRLMAVVNKIKEDS